MKSINPKDYKDFDVNTISYLTLKDGSVIMFDESIPPKNNSNNKVNNSSKHISRNSNKNTVEIPKKLEKKIVVPNKISKEEINIQIIQNYKKNFIVSISKDISFTLNDNNNINKNINDNKTKKNNSNSKLFDDFSLKFFGSKKKPQNKISFKDFYGEEETKTQNNTNEKRKNSSSRQRNSKDTVSIKINEYSDKTESFSPINNVNKNENNIRNRKRKSVNFTMEKNNQQLPLQSRRRSCILIHPAIPNYLKNANIVSENTNISKIKERRMSQIIARKQTSIIDVDRTGTNAIISLVIPGKHKEKKKGKIYRKNIKEEFNGLMTKFRQKVERYKKFENEGGYRYYELYKNTSSKKYETLSPNLQKRKKLIKYFNGTTSNKGINLFNSLNDNKEPLGAMSYSDFKNKFKTKAYSTTHSRLFKRSRGCVFPKNEILYSS